VHEISIALVCAYAVAGSNASPAANAMSGTPTAMDVTSLIRARRAVRVTRASSTRR
jgi:hypothetical protein